MSSKKSRALGDIDVLAEGTDTVEARLTSIREDLTEIQELAPDTAPDEADAFDSALASLDDAIAAVGDGSLTAQSVRMSLRPAPQRSRPDAGVPRHTQRRAHEPRTSSMSHNGRGDARGAHHSVLLAKGLSAPRGTAEPDHPTVSRAARRMPRMLAPFAKGDPMARATAGWLRRLAVVVLMLGACGDHDDDADASAAPTTPRRSRGTRSCRPGSRGRHSSTARRSR